MKFHCKRSEERRGVLKKKTWFKLEARVEMTAEEQAALEKAGDFKDRILFTTMHQEPLGENTTSVAQFVKNGFFGADPDLSVVNEWEETVKDGAKNLKAHLEGFMEGDTDKEEVIDL